MGKIKIKPLKKIEDLIGNKRFKFPESLADERYEGKLCIFVMIGGKATHIPVEEYVPIEYNVYCLLKDTGRIPHGSHFEEGEEFNPWA